MARMDADRPDLPVLPVYRGRGDALLVRQAQHQQRAEQGSTGLTRVAARAVAVDAGAVAVRVSNPAGSRPAGRVLGLQNAAGDLLPVHLREHHRTVGALEIEAPADADPTCRRPGVLRADGRDALRDAPRAGGGLRARRRWDLHSRYAPHSGRAAAHRA